MPLLIEDYALIGDRETAALVGRNGSIDWLCWPNFASPACFASLLGSAKNGFWRLAPTEGVVVTTRRYESRTLVLETKYETRRGAVQVLDFMPERKGHSRIVRIVKGMRGRVSIRSDLALRFSYGEAVPWVTRTPSGLHAVAGPDAIEFQTSAPIKYEDFRYVSEISIRENESVSFVLTYLGYGKYREDSRAEPIDVDAALTDTRKFWMGWADRSTYRGPYRENVQRSLITLKALAYRPTGGIVAAPTTSLPEEIGGVRNWDYRYCWLRDATFTLLALLNEGYDEEARDWMHWLHRTVAGKPDQLQIMYGIAGERALIESTIKWLPGYEASSPVRIGNAASEQLQLDIYGEVLDAFFWTYKGLPQDKRRADFGLLRSLVEHLESVWQKPDQGIWETRGPAKHFVYSKVMAWVAFDRAIKLAEHGSYPAPLKHWKRVRQTIHTQVCRKGFSKRLNSFVQHYGSTHLDASVLLLAMVGFLPPEDPRIRGTVQAIERNLMEDGLVRRYKTSKSADGLPGGEGKFLACSFWLVNNLVLIGRRGEAHTLFERLLTIGNDVGLFSEEYATDRKRQVGNFPQALTHIALVGAAHQLAGHGGLRRHMAGFEDHSQ